VRAGQYLGRIGMSGSTLGVPHLHVHVEKDGNPVAMPFEHGMSTPSTFLDPPDKHRELLRPVDEVKGQRPVE
jgi:murein DD-endopeptidase MepM/ murein hydrolase activator NlpD